jgi:hypothetical protein
VGPNTRSLLFGGCEVPFWKMISEVGSGDQLRQRSPGAGALKPPKAGIERGLDGIPAVLPTSCVSWGLLSIEWR